MSVLNIYAAWDQTIPGVQVSLAAAQQNSQLIQNYIQQKKAEEMARREAQARAFNAAVADYNRRAADLFNRTNNYYGDISGRNIAQISGRSEYNPLSAFSNELSGLTFNTTRPTFSNEFNIANDTGYITEAIGAPSLDSIDNSFSGRISSALNNTRSTLDRLYTDRGNEENRISSFFSNFQNDISKAAERANQINFADMAGMEAGRATQADLEGRLGGFSSLLNPDTSGLRSALTNYDARLDTLYNDRAAEEGRIQEFRSGITSAFSPVRDATSNLTIRDIDQIIGNQNKLNELTSSVNRFSSILNPSFNDETAAISGTSNQLNNLLKQRQDEIARIDNTSKDFFERSSGLTNEAANAGIYSKAALESLQGKVGGLEKEIGGFSSLLDFNFGDSQNYLAEAGKRISDLYSQRANTLNTIGSTAAQTAAGVADVPLYQEDDFNDRKSTISEQISELNKFSGDDIAPVQSQAQSALDAVTGRLNELYGYRNNLEGRAQSFLGDLNNQSFYQSQAVLDAMGEGSAFDQLRDEVDLYRASQANDEIASADNRYNRELARLLLDEKKRAELAEAEAAAIRGRNAASVPLYSKGMPLTEQEYQAFILGRRRQQDEIQNQRARASSFARALGVVG